MTIPTTGLERGVVERGTAESKDRFLLAYQKGVDLETRTVPVVASTIQIDRDGEIILPSAMAKTLPVFLKGHAPLLTQHTHRTDSGTPGQIGWCMDGAGSAKDVRLDIRFAESDPADACERWWRRASSSKGKGIAVSIGFYPKRWVYGSTADLVRDFAELKPIFAEAGLKDDDKLRVYSEIELYELSVVGVPSNRGALQVLGAKGICADPDAAPLAGDDVGEAFERLLAESRAIVERQAALAEGLEALRFGLADLKETMIALVPDPVNPIAAPSGGPGGDDAERRAGGGEEDGAEAEGGPVDRLLETLKT